MTTKVGQVTPYLCTLACIESILKDAGRTVGCSQADIANTYPHDCSAQQMDWNGKSKFGSVTLQRIPVLLLSYGLGDNLRFGNAMNVLKEVGSKVGVNGYGLLMTTNPTCHCVRVVAAHANGDVEVMDPSENGGISTWSRTEIQNRDCYAVCVWT